MHKINKLVFMTLFFVGLFSLFSINISAQKGDTTVANVTEKSTKTCSGEKFVMPATIAVGNDAFGDFIKVASLPMKERKEAFSKLSNEQKSAFIKVNWALQFVKRPNMTKPQKEFVLDTISKISADLWDKSDSEKMRRSELFGIEAVNKAFALFSFKEAGDFVEPLNTDKNVEVGFLQKYENVLTNGSILRRTIVKEMPANDRVNIWKVQLAYHLATGKFSKVQNEFMLEMMASLSPEMFASGVNLTEEESKAIVSRILNVFTKDEAFAIFMSIGIQKYIKDISVETSIPGTPTCTCKWSCEGNNKCGDKVCISGNVCGPWGLTLCHSLCEAT